ncbi:helix-turn-helix transcriptional regulator [Agaribacterium sp. ZY112]|uniref:helix-turn-helix transcriptional regulator n=1 Tax=Agaribacterium sp. ZY112 TaxID=3233574 RepID=UPI003523A6DD
MIFLPTHSILFVLLPLLSAQLLFLALLYFALVGRRVLPAFGLHSLFLLSFALYLIGQTLQFYTDLQTAIYILFARGLLFMGFGIPALQIALYEQCARKLSGLTQLFMYLFAVLLTLLFLSVQDLANYNFIYTEQFEQSLGFDVVNNMALVLLTVYMTLLLFLPCLWLLWRELRSKTKANPINIALLSGALMVAIAQLAIHHISDSYWLTSVGAVFTALCWVGAVYLDAKRTRGRAYAVKDELLYLLRSGTVKEKSAELDRLWAKLAGASEGDLQLYKLQVRELLSSLSELSIDAGANSHEVLQRADESLRAIERIDSESELSHIASQESKALGEAIVDAPVRRSEKAVDQAKAYIAERYAEDIDVKKVAKHCSASPSYLMRQFKLHTGQTLNQYLTATRIERAKNLLTTMSVTETAFKVGFNNSNYFSTVFKKETGQTPGQFQSQL